MSNIFDINTMTFTTPSDIVYAMHDMTSEDGKLYAVPYNTPSGVEFIGFYNCDMFMEAWDEEYQDFAYNLDILVGNIIANAADSGYEDTVVMIPIEDNAFADKVHVFQRRITRLLEFGAPKIVVVNEIKALAFYYVLNRYCCAL